MERSREFREGLGRELPVWQAEGIVTPGAARALAARYDLDAGSAPAAAARDRSGIAAGVAGAGVACALAIALAGSGSREGALLPVAALGAALAAAPLAARGEALAPAAAALRGVGRGTFYLAAWGLSFVAVAGALRLRSPASAGLLAAIPAFLVAVGALAAGLRRTDVDPHARGEAMLLAATVLAFGVGLFLENGKGAAIVANMALAFLAAGRIVRGVSWLTRGPFWEGLLVAAVIVASRVADVAPSGWARTAGWIVAAAAAAFGGLAFERHRSRAPSAGLHAT